MLIYLYMYIHVYVCMCRCALFHCGVFKVCLKVTSRVQMCAFCPLQNACCLIHRTNAVVKSVLLQERISRIKAGCYLE